MFTVFSAVLRVCRRLLLVSGAAVCCLRAKRNELCFVFFGTTNVQMCITHMRYRIFEEMHANEKTTNTNLPSHRLAHQKNKNEKTKKNTYTLKHISLCINRTVLWLLVCFMFACARNMRTRVVFNPSNCRVRWPKWCVVLVQLAYSLKCFELGRITELCARALRYAPVRLCCWVAQV